MTDHYTQDTEIGIEVRRNDDEECVGYLPTQFSRDLDWIDERDPVEIMEHPEYRDA